LQWSGPGLRASAHRAPLGLPQGVTSRIPRGTRFFFILCGLILGIIPRAPPKDRRRGRDWRAWLGREFFLGVRGGGASGQGGGTGPGSAPGTIEGSGELGPCRGPPMERRVGREGGPLAFFPKAGPPGSPDAPFTGGPKTWGGETGKCALSWGGGRPDFGKPSFVAPPVALYRGETGLGWGRTPRPRGPFGGGPPLTLGAGGP